MGAEGICLVTACDDGAIRVFEVHSPGYLGAHIKWVAQVSQSAAANDSADTEAAKEISALKGQVCLCQSSRT